MGQIVPINVNTADREVLRAVLGAGRSVLAEEICRRRDAYPVTDLNQVLHYRSNSAEAHFLISRARLGRGENVLQRQELAEALRLAQAFLAARLELAQALTSSGDAQSARDRRGRERFQRR